ncbi:MAG: hypothetical protein ACLGPL_00140, partial [Acidobacteriota bacterium]
MIERIQESSQYLGTLLRCRAEYVDWLVAQRNISRRYGLMELYQDLQRTVRDADSFPKLLSAFRIFKQRHFLRIGGRDLLGTASLAETTAQLSDLASVAFQVGLDILNEHPEWWAGEGSEAWRTLKDEIKLTVMGLGKLGGQELNYVSDVDILFFYGLRKDVSILSGDGLMLLNRLCQWLVKLLSETVDGDRVFIVDLRLRPKGKDGPLVPPLWAAAEHYLHQGHPWERQMLLKARPVAGDRTLGTAFLHEVRPFVFRRFLDFQALDELRTMRDKILAEAVRPRSGWQQFDVKLGIGGIREVEFLVQSLQLIYGGRHPVLDEPSTLKCLDRLHELNLLPDRMVKELRESYIFLRRVEHWVQLDQNRQTQKLPQSEEAKVRLAKALGFGGDEKLFLERLQDCCSVVHGHFRGLFHSKEEENEPQESVSSFENFAPESLERLRSLLSAFPPSITQAVQKVLARFDHVRDREIAEKIFMRLERYFTQ